MRGPRGVNIGKVLKDHIKELGEEERFYYLPHTHTRVHTKSSPLHDVEGLLGRGDV